MGDTALAMKTEEAPRERPRSGATSALARVGRYTVVRLVVLFVTVIVGIYLVVLVANMGGYVDKIRLGNIQQTISLQISQDQSPEIRALSAAERQQMIRERVEVEVRRQGLDRPFIVRSFGYLKGAIALDLGFATDMTSDSGSKQVRLILLERLPSTLVLWGAANLSLFFISLFFGLFLSRKYGTILDRIVIALAPTSSAPAWFYGIFLILIFAAVLQILPFGGMVSAPPPETKIGYALSLAKHLILPTSAIVISTIFLQTYNFRTFFLIYSMEDYVEMAKAKGLSDREIERRYVLRPVLPTIITQFALMLIYLWTGATILETVFNWPGLGRALYQAIGLFDTPVIVGSQVIFAYLLAATVFLLDFVYALVDPRVRIGGGGSR